jgi:hypothetical protein
MPSLSQFKNSFTLDIARPKLFDIIIVPPTGLQNYIGIARNLTFRCESTQFPSRTFATTEQKFGTNPVEKHAYQTTYNDIEISFIVSEDMSEKKFFDAWMNLINPTASFDFNYRNDYITDFYVFQYDGTQTIKTYSIALLDAFPISVNQLDLDWSNDNYHKLSVTFAYRYWKNIGAEDQAKEILVVPDNINSTDQTTYGENGVNSVQDRKNQPSYQYVLQQEREAVAAQRGADL